MFTCFSVVFKGLYVNVSECVSAVYANQAVSVSVFMHTYVNLSVSENVSVAVFL